MKNKMDMKRTCEPEEATGIINPIQSSTTAECLHQYGFPFYNHDCARRCQQNEECKKSSRLKLCYKLKWLSRSTVTIQLGETSSSSVVTAPILKELYSRLLAYAGTNNQKLIFMFDKQGTAIDFKPYQEWRKTIDPQQ